MHHILCPQVQAYKTGHIQWVLGWLERLLFLPKNPNPKNSWQNTCGYLRMLRRFRRSELTPWEMTMFGVAEVRDLALGPSRCKHDEDEK
jgi:hypothetical protein